MNRLIIVGNGFDKSLGLETGYLDFLFWYFNRIISDLNNVLTYTDEIWSITISNPKNYTLIEDSSQLRPFYQQISRHNVETDTILKNPVLLSHLTRDASINNWVDVEESYFYLLKDMLRRNDWAQIERLNNELESIEKYLVEYLTNIENNNRIKNISFNPEILSKDFNPSEVPHLIDPGKAYKTNIENLAILSFNYTGYAGLIEKQIPPTIGKQMIYIHGRIGEHENPIIFGYGDENPEEYQKLVDANKEECLKHIKSYKYLKTDRYRTLMSFISQQPFDVHIIGASCGVSDRVMLSTIFNSKYCLYLKTIIHKRTDETDDFFSKSVNISRHFNTTEGFRSKMAIKPDCIYFSKQ